VSGSGRLAAISLACGAEGLAFLAGTLVSLNLEKPTATVNHFAIGIPRYNKDAAVRYFTERGVKPLEGNFAGFHVLDPDGVRVQISAQS
jgi:hypothetical protein